MRTKLVATGSIPLIEATYDPFWGAGAPITARRLRDGTWRGRNVFGLILDQVRTEMRRECANLDHSNPSNPSQKQQQQQQSSSPPPVPHPHKPTPTPRPTGAPPLPLLSLLLQLQLCKIKTKTDLPLQESRSHSPSLWRITLLRSLRSITAEGKEVAT